MDRKRAGAFPTPRGLGNPPRLAATKTRETRKQKQNRHGERNVSLSALGERAAAGSPKGGTSGPRKLFGGGIGRYTPCWGGGVRGLKEVVCAIGGEGRNGHEQSSAKQGPRGRRQIAPELPQCKTGGGNRDEEACIRKILAERAEAKSQRPEAGGIVFFLSKKKRKT